MKELINKIARKVADTAGARYLVGPGTRKLRKLLPEATLYSLDTAWDNVLILAPHPDDEVFGAGLLLDRLREKKCRVTIAFATCGDAYSTGTGGDRKKEAQASAARYGAEVIFLNLKDGQLQNTQGLDEKICALCARIQPQAIVLPWFGDYHSDHRALARAAMASPFTKAQYLFYSTFSPLWPSKGFKLSFLIGKEGGVMSALEGYSSSVNRETIHGFLTLRRALARCYLNNNTFWELMLTIPGQELARISDLAAAWPHIYPTLKKARHWRIFMREVRDLRQSQE